MRVVVTADFHGTLPKIPKCDLLLIAGDVTPVHNHERGFQRDYLKTEFSDWLQSVPATHIVGIGGNHDFALNRWKDLGHELPWNYLHNESVEVNGLKVWGSPYSVTFGNWTFMRPESGLAEMYERIPQDVDIVLSHGPAYGVLDESKYYVPGRDPHVGSTALRNRLSYGTFPELKMLAFGHIHEGYGKAEVGGLIHVNGSLMDSGYDPVNSPIVVEL